MIDETGSFTAAATGGGFSTSVLHRFACGTITLTSSTLTFAGSTARLDESVASDRCGTLTVEATLAHDMNR